MRLAAAWDGRVGNTAGEDRAGVSGRLRACVQHVGGPVVAVDPVDDDDVAV
jgi:hypothetical protein